LIPIGILEPVELEGSTVKRVSLYNYRFCLEHFKNGVHGAEVELVKAGDIIPQVLKVVTEPYSNDYWIPKKCPKCGGEIEIKDVHIICINPECSGADVKKFIFGVSQLGMEHFGGKTLEKIYEAGIKNPIHILSIDKDFMIKNGFGDGRSSQRLLEQIKLVSEITLEQVLLTLGIDNLGTTIAKQLAKWFAQTGDFNPKGMQKDIIEDFVNKGESYKLLIDSLNYLNKIGKKVIIPKKSNSQIKYIEATGSPKSAGFLTKEDFFKYASQFGFENDSLSKSSQYLITDSYTSVSGKMSKANKLGIEIITFEDFCKKYN
jgi:DNA ligase (NAD+)